MPKISDPEPYKVKRKPKQSKAGSLYVAKGYDQCQTPAYALDPLLPFIPTCATVWDPAMGEGYLCRAVHAAGITAIGSDIIYGRNFLFDPAPSRLNDDLDWIVITNPPYSGSLKVKFLARCMELEKPFAMLVPSEFTSTKGAQKYLFNDHGMPLYEEMKLSDRINFKMPAAGWTGSGTQFPVIWLCRNMLPLPLMLGIVNKRDEQ